MTHLGPFENKGVQHLIGFISMAFKSKVDSGEVDVEVVEVKRGGLPLNESKRKRYMAL